MNSIKDFDPESIVSQVPELKRLLELREALKSLRGPLANVPEFRKVGYGLHLPFRLGAANEQVVRYCGEFLDVEDDDYFGLLVERQLGYLEGHFLRFQLNAPYAFFRAGRRCPAL